MEEETIYFFKRRATILKMVNQVSIGYFADGPWSHEAFNLLIKDQNIDIRFIVPRSDTQDTTLKGFCEKFDIDYLANAKINSAEFYDRAKSYNCDLFVSMSFNQIFKHRIMNLPPMKTINCHAGKLPFYRGRNILNWALINDEKEYGITVHYVDEGIDTGDIILQRDYSISDADTYKTLLNRAHRDCADILYDAIKLLQEGEADRIVQNEIHPVGMYCGARGMGDEVINWDKNSRELFNFIRAICYPGPKALTYCDGKEVKINGSRLITGAPVYIGTTGQVIGRTGSGYLVKTLDSFIEVFDIETDAKLRIGSRLQ
ncbi:formyltransferase family protein [Pseudomonadales bacterium]|nr:formyltransferase family protein [Pseudomonadales bacterium]